MDDRVFFIPLPVIFQIKSMEKFFSALKGLGNGVDKQAFAETPGTGKKIIFPLGRQSVD